jgi:hypothetical protein
MIACGRAGIEQLPPRVDPERVILAEDLAELLRGFPVECGDFLQVCPKRGDEPCRLTF